MDTKPVVILADSFVAELSLLWALLAIPESRRGTKRLPGADPLQFVISALLLAEAFYLELHPRQLVQPLNRLRRGSIPSIQDLR